MMTATPIKQRLTVAPPQGQIATLTGAPASAVTVVDVKPGSVTWLDRAKAYYHTAFAVLAGLAVLIVEIGPDLNALPGLPPTWRHAITVAVVIANMIATRVKANEQWFNAAAQPARP